MDLECSEMDIGRLEEIFIPPIDKSLQSRYELIKVSGLEKNGIYNNYYINEQKCFFAPNDSNLVIGITDTNNVILGSY